MNKMGNSKGHWVKNVPIYNCMVDTLFMMCRILVQTMKNFKEKRKLNSTKDSKVLISPHRRGEDRERGKPAIIYYNIIIMHIIRIIVL